MDKELERFKTDINLTEYAASCGYVIDKKESWGSSVVMRHENTDKITVTKVLSGPWVFCSNHDRTFNGTIVDFCQGIEGGTLGQVRASLRKWMKSPPSVPASSFVRDVKPMVKDKAKAFLEYEKALIKNEIPCLLSRGIGPELLSRPEFAGKVRIDARKNAIFGHYDKEGFCGFEIKNTGFTSFSSGGFKGLWFSQPSPDDKALVIAESAVDALSYAGLHPDLKARYVSTGGTMNPNQPALLVAAMAKLPAGAEVLLAFDNDEGGERMAAEILALAPAGVHIHRAFPPVGVNDWNDALKQSRGIWETPPKPVFQKPLIVSHQKPKKGRKPTNRP